MNSKGFTLIETLIVITIIGILAVVGFICYTSFQRSVEMESVARQTVDTLREAQSKTMAGEELSQWGVHFETDKFVLFYGSSYDPNELKNQVNGLSSAVKISNITLSGGGSDVVFDKLEGTTSNFGTGANDAALRVELATQPSTYKTITITQEGKISVE